MASILALRDQENLHHAHQTTAAAKPLNQGSRALAPKTPGNRVAKTPFKLPLNDENGIDAAKAGLGKGKVNGSLFTGASKAFGERNAFVTPVAPKTRAPLGQKTTNAKARPFQTPAPLQEDTVLDKLKPKSVSVRKPKPKTSHAEPVKIDVLDTRDEEEPEIEYMPPRPKDLPDLPDDIDANLDFSMFANNGARRDFIHHLNHHKGWDGLSAVERDEIRAKRAEERINAENEAFADYIMDGDPIPCLHDPECPTQDCKDAPAIRREAKAKYEQKLAEIDEHFKSLPPLGLDYLAKQPSAKKQINITKGPTDEVSKRAAFTLSMPKPKVPGPAKASAKKPFSSQVPSALVSRPKKPTHPPTNPSTMRHAAAVAASHTTMGYSKGRATSASLRKAQGPTQAGNVSSRKEIRPDPNSLSPADFMKQYGEPRFMTEMWIRCRSQGLIKLPGDEDKVEQQESAMGGPDGLAADDYFREEAERDFEFKMPF